MKRVIRIVVFAYLSFFPINPTQADVITLNSGKEVKGRIVHETDELIRVDAGIGVLLTYFRDEIVEISVEQVIEPDIQKTQIEDQLKSDDEILKRDKSFLWEVKSGDSINYILGSIHYAREDFYPLPALITDAFDRSEVLAVEADVLNVKVTDIQAKLMEEAMYLDGSKLYENIDPKTYNMLKQYAEKNDLPLKPMMMMKPWMAAMTVVDTELRRLGFSAFNGIDMHFLKKANGNKPIVELEGVKNQLKMLSLLEDQDMFLYYTLIDIKRAAEVFEEIIQHWQTGNTKGLDKMLIRDLINEHPELSVIYEELFFKRNRAMTERIEEYIKSNKPHFVIVGAGHLLGDEGVIRLLESKGYEVRQL